jgi:steroid 5-alpha reductase family enzyme
VFENEEKMKKIVSWNLVVFIALCIGVVSGAHADDNAEATKEPPDSKVHVLEYEGFWRFLDRHPLILLEFYAPWW